MKLTALGPIRHDGKRHAPGDTFEVKNKAQAQALIDCGSAEPAEKTEADATAKTGADTGGDGAKG
jgi:hypothetical protein